MQHFLSAMNNYKAIILVLASTGGIYDEFREYWSYYENYHSDIKVLFVYGNSGVHRTNPNDLVFDVEETYTPGMLQKTIKAMEYIDNVYNYQFLIRTNLSTFWDLDQLYKRINNLIPENCLLGTLRSCSHNNLYYHNYISGTNQVYSRDVVQKLIPGLKTMLHLDLPEDLVISKYCTELLKLKRMGTGAVLLMEDYKDTGTVLEDIREARKLGRDNFRVKNSDRELDMQITRILLKEVYGVGL